MDNIITFNIGYIFAGIRSCLVDVVCTVWINLLHNN